MTAYHSQRLKRAYWHFRGDVRSANRLQGYAESIYNVLERANRLGISPHRDRVLELFKKHVYKFSKQPTRTMKAVSSYVGFGFYKNGEWDVLDWEHFLIRSNWYTDIKTRKEDGVYIDSIETCKEHLDHQYNLREHEYTGFNQCSCGKLHKHTELNVPQSWKYLHYCKSCAVKLLKIDNEIKETAEVKRLINKLKKVIKDENKRPKIKVNDGNGLNF